MSRTFRKCCKEETRDKKTNLNEEDEGRLSQEIHVPENVKPGMDHELLQGFGGRRTIREAMDNLSGNGSMRRVKIKYKPKEIVAYYIQSDHEEDSKRKRKSGWLVPGPGRGIFYVPEELFNKFFEFIEDEGRIIA